MVLGMSNTITTKRVQRSELALDDTHQKEGSTKKGSSLNKSCRNGTVNWSRDRLSRRPVNKVLNISGSATYCRVLLNLWASLLHQVNTGIITSTAQHGAWPKKALKKQ